MSARRDGSVIEEMLIRSSGGIAEDPVSNVANYSSYFSASEGLDIRV